ncbi:uncharacterized protein LOC120330289 [Styela clava]
MGKPGMNLNLGASRKTKPTEYTSSMKKRRRASQAKHRLNVATCYQKLRMSIPGVNNDHCNKSRSNRCLNKADLLYRAKEYIVHLEKSMEKLLNLKGQMTPSLDHGSERDDEILTNEISNFKRMDQFKDHFASTFQVDRNAASYLYHSAETRSTLKHQILSHRTKTSMVTVGEKDRNLNHCHVQKETLLTESQSPTAKSKGSSQQSDDLGFVSAEGGSQDQHHSNNINKKISQSSTQQHWNGCCMPQCNVQGAPGSIHTFGSPFVHYPATVFNTFPDCGFMDPSNFYFYVPTAGYPRQFYTSLDDHHSYLANGIPPMHATYNMPGQFLNTSSLVGQTGSFVAGAEQATTSYQNIIFDDMKKNQDSQMNIESVVVKNPSAFIEELNTSKQENKIEVIRENSINILDFSLINRYGLVMAPYPGPVEPR